MRHFCVDAHYWGYIFLPDPSLSRTFLDRVLGVFGVRRTAAEALLPPTDQHKMLGHIPGELSGNPS
ncbi:MAG: hypothetical protein ACRC7O_03635, partial [Fimbriiglobus sp.]